MYSQANVRVESVLRPPTRALPSVIVVTEKVMREADGLVGRAALTAHFGWKGDRPGVHLESRSGELVRSPKITSAARNSLGGKIFKGLWGRPTKTPDFGTSF